MAVRDTQITIDVMVGDANPNARDTQLSLDVVEARGTTTTSTTTTGSTTTTYEFYEDFENGNYNKWDSVSSTPPDFVNWAGWNGVQCDTYIGRWIRKNVAPGDEIYMSWRGHFDGGAPTYMFFILNGSAQTLLRMRWYDTTGAFYADRGSTNIADSVDTLTLFSNNNYEMYPNLLELYFKCANTGGRVVFKVNGMTAIDFTGDTDPYTSSDIEIVQFGSGTGFSMIVDDIKISRTAWPPPSRIPSLVHEFYEDFERQSLEQWQYIDGVDESTDIVAAPAGMSGAYALTIGTGDYLLKYVHPTKTIYMDWQWVQGTHDDSLTVYANYANLNGIRFYFYKPTKLMRLYAGAGLVATVRIDCSIVRRWKMKAYIDETDGYVSVWIGKRRVLHWKGDNTAGVKQARVTHIRLKTAAATSAGGTFDNVRYSDSGWPDTGVSTTTSTTSTTSSTSTTTTYEFADDFETGDTSKWTGYGGSPSFSIYRGYLHYPRFGNVQLLLSNAEYVYKTVTANDEYYVSFYWGRYSSNFNELISFMDGTTDLIYIRHSDSGGAWYVVRGGSTIVTTSFTHLYENYYPQFIQIYVKIHDTSGRVVMKINGETIVDYTGDTDPGSSSQINRIQLGKTVWYGGVYDNFKASRTQYPEQYKEWRPRLLTTGFENQELISWDWADDVVAGDIEAASPPFAGNFLVNLDTYGANLRKAIVPSDEVFIDFNFQSSSTGLMHHLVWLFCGLSDLCSFGQDNAGNLYLNVNAVQQDTAPANTNHHRYQMHAKIHDTNGFIKIFDSNKTVLMRYDGDTTAGEPLAKVTHVMHGYTAWYGGKQDNIRMSIDGWPAGLTTTTTTTTHFWDEDFEAMTAGDPPTGWSEDWSTAPATTVELKGRDKSLVLDLSSNVRAAVTHDLVNKYDCEVLGLVKAIDAYATLAGALGLRISGSAGNETGYVAFMDCANGELVLRRYKAAVSTELATIAATITAGKWYWIRFRADGADLKAKIWGRYESEPSGWDIEHTDTTDPIATAGSAGVCAYNADAYCDYIAVEGYDYRWPVGQPTWQSTTTSTTTTYTTTTPGTTTTTTTEYSDTYSTNFSGYTLDAAPSDFTEVWSPPVAAMTVIDELGQYGLASLRIDHSTFGHYFAKWDDVPAHRNSDILVKVKFNDLYPSASQDYFRIVTRQTGSDASKNGYELRLYPSNDEMRIYRTQAGVSSQRGPSYSVTITEGGGWLWVRFRVKDQTLKARVWSGQPSDEPAVWHIDTTDSNLAGPGYVGLGSYNGDSTYVDYLGVGIGGLSAPAPADYVTTTTTTTTTTSTTTTGTTETPMDPSWYVSLGMVQN